MKMKVYTIKNENSGAEATVESSASIKQIKFLLENSKMLIESAKGIGLYKG